MKFEIKSGFLAEIVAWRIEKKEQVLVGSASPTIDAHISFDCISSVTKLEEVDKDVYVEINFTNGGTSVVKTSKRVAAFLYELQFSSKKVKFKLTEKNVLPQLLAGIGFILIILFVSLSQSEGDTSSTGNSSQQLELSPLTKVALCREYIGEIFGRPVDIIKGAIIKDGSIYVGYVREEDRTSWVYSCDFHNNKMVWAGWFNDEKKLGRWRSEDEVTLNFNSESNSVSFRMSNKNFHVKVQ